MTWGSRAVDQQYVQLRTARALASYLTGHAFARLHDALGYAHHETAGFSLIEDADLQSADDFICGFSDSVRQSLDADVMRVIGGSATAGNGVLINNLCHFIGDHMAAAPRSE